MNDFLKIQELKDVKLSKNDTCLTYVLKRLGLKDSLCTYTNYHEFFHQYPYKNFNSKLEMGDILLWDKDMKWDWMPISIKGKNVIWENVPRGFHFGIYEGEGFFSDCTRLVTPPHPSLRMRCLNSLQKYPDWILRLNESTD